MKASVQYNDIIGHASADIFGIDYDKIAQQCKLGDRYTIIGVSLHGTDEININLICRDNIESTDEKEVLVDLYPDVELSVSDVIERLNITINITKNKKYDDPSLDTDGEVNMKENED